MTHGQTDIQPCVGAPLAFQILRCLYRNCNAMAHPKFYRRRPRWQGRHTCFR